MRYYDLKRNWTKKVEPHLGDAELNRVLVTNFNKFTYGRWGIEFKPGEFPRQHETCLWDFDHRGPEPRYWRYVKHAACHWLVNFHLRLAMLVMPKRPWRIISSNNHSTVWDGKETLFDFNYQALEVSPDECFKTAMFGSEPREHLQPGEYLKLGLADHFRFYPVKATVAQHSNDEKCKQWLDGLPLERRREISRLAREYKNLKRAA